MLEGLAQALSQLIAEGLAHQPAHLSLQAVADTLCALDRLQRRDVEVDLLDRLGQGSSLRVGELRRVARVDG